MKFLYTIDPTADEPIMLINKHIGYDKDEKDPVGIMGHQFEQELLTLDGMDKKCIKVYINSPGGSVMDGMSIYNSILKSTTPVDTYCTGIAASIAAVIFEAGRNRTMADYAKLMYHNPYNPSGNKDKSLDVMKDAIVKMITGRNSKGKTEEEVGAVMDKTTWLSAKEAIEEGFAEHTDDSGAFNKKYLRSTDAKAMWQEANLILNRTFNIQNNSDMSDLKAITNRLKINENSTPDAIVNAFNEAMDKSAADKKKAEDDLKTAEDARDKAKTDFDNKCSEYDKLKKEKDDMDTEMDKVKEETAKNMVTGFARQGKIKNDEPTIKLWSDKAKADFEGTKALLDTMKGNKDAAKIEVDTVNNIDTLRVNQAAITMASIRNQIEKNTNKA